MRENFEFSLGIGREKEIDVLNIFRNDGWIGGLINYPEYKAYGDLWVIKDKIPFVIQVKNEDNYVNSPYIWIEVFQGNPKKPSGISICEGQICIHTFMDDAAIYRTQYMRLFLSKNRDKYPVRLALGSDNDNKGQKVPIKDLIGERWFDYCLFEKIPISKIFSKE